MGALVINNNTQAINAHRNLLNVDRQLKGSLERLSSGEKIVRAADGPAQLMISEQMRAQIASISQALDNTETGVSMLQTTEASLDEVSRQLVAIRQRAVHAANEGANDQNQLAADQFEVENALASIDRIAKFAAFGKKNLLDGSNGVNGLAAGEGLVFLKATPNTRQSPDEGFEVRISQVATKANLTSINPLSKDVIDQGLTLSVEENGRVATLTTNIGEDIDTVVQNLQNAMERDGLDLEVSKTEDDRLVIQHKEFGSDPTFTVVSTLAGVFSDQESAPITVKNGMDVAGTIDNQLTVGKGRVLEAARGTKPDGLQVLFEGETPADPSLPVGNVKISQGSLIFQIGPDAGQSVSIALNTINARTLGLNVDNTSKFRSLNEVDVTSFKGAEDTMRLVDKAIDDVNKVRGDLGALQKNAMESNLRSLAVSREEMTAAESVIRDADMAIETAQFTRNQIVLQSAMSMLAQANQVPRNVLGLIQNV